MSEDLDVELWVRKPRRPAEFVTSLLEEAQSLGLHYAGFYYDESVSDDPPIYRSHGEGIHEWSKDFPRVVRAAREQGWADVAYEWISPAESNVGLMLYAGPPSHPGLKDERGVQRGKWWLARISTELKGLSSGKEMGRFLDDVVIPICSEVRPRMGFGDILSRGPVYRPSESHLEDGVPRAACWFNYYDSEVVQRTRGHSWFKDKATVWGERAEKAGGWRVQTFEDGSALLILTPVPRWEQRERARHELSLPPS